MARIGSKLIEDTEFVKQCTLKKEFLSQRRNSILVGQDDNGRLSYVSEILIYDDKLSRIFANLHAQVLSEYLETAECKE